MKPKRRPTGLLGCREHGRVLSSFLLKVWSRHGQRQPHLGACENCRLGPHSRPAGSDPAFDRISRGFLCASKFEENQSIPHGPQQAWCIIRIPCKAQNIPRPHHQLTESELLWVAQGLVLSPNILFENVQTHRNVIPAYPPRLCDVKMPLCFITYLCIYPSIDPSYFLNIGQGKMQTAGAFSPKYFSMYMTSLIFNKVSLMRLFI